MARPPVAVDGEVGMRSTMLVCAALVGVVGMSSCKKDAAIEDASTGQAAPDPTSGAELADVVQTLVGRFRRVSFDTDSDALTAESKSLLADNGALLKQWPQVRVIVEGHADERGTTEYNVALGARRAAAVERALRVHGAQATQVETLSYGEERPIELAHHESAWSANRRVEFLVVAGSEVVAGTY